MTTVEERGVLSSKERMLQAALKLFASKGYEAVSVRDIADSLSMTKGALYRHYKNKRDILDCIIQRMVETDARTAEEFTMPEGTLEQMEEKYKSTTLENIVAFSEAQFARWTEDEFAASFRKLLTLEQYRDTEMSKLFHQYLGLGPLGYIEDLFREISKDAGILAVEFYAPVFFLYSVYDGTDDKSAVKLLLKKHLDRFVRRLEECK